MTLIPTNRKKPKYAKLAPAIEVIQNHVPAEDGLLTINYYRNIIGVHPSEWGARLAAEAKLFAMGVEAGNDMGSNGMDRVGVITVKGICSVNDGVKAMLAERRFVTEAGGICSGSDSCDRWRLLIADGVKQIGCSKYYNRTNDRTTVACAADKPKPENRNEPVY